MMMLNDFLAKLNLALNSKTMYVRGCFGAPLKSSTINRYKNLNDKRWNAMVANADKGYFGFDCVCLVKSILWGWNADWNAVYGGAQYASNGVADMTEDAMLKSCKDVSSDFSNIVAGEFLWMQGHCGIYVGDNKVIECTAAWDSKVLMSGLTSPYEGRQHKWLKHGKLPFVDYGEQPIVIAQPTASKPELMSYEVDDDKRIITIKMKY